MTVVFLFLAAASATDCRVVRDDVIRMRDLAAVEPAFSPADSDLVVGYSPQPGSTRILPAAQLARMAHQYGIDDGEFRDVCFQRAMGQLNEHDLLDTIRHSLAIPGAEVEVVEFSHFPVPVGDLVFPRSGLALTPSAVALLWKGYVVYGGGRHFPIWARVKLRVKLSRVVATDNLVTNKPVGADQVRMEPLDGVPDALAPAQSLDLVVGKILLRPVRRGASVSLDDVSTAIAIRRGDKVHVDFESPVVHLRFEAAAETDGRFGDRIRLRNLQSSNVFVADVSGKDQARVVSTEANDDEANHSGASVRPTGYSCGGSGQEEEKGCH